MTKRFTKYPSTPIKASADKRAYDRRAYDDAIAPFLSDNEVYYTLNQFEKKILAKAANSIDYQVYLLGAIEALDLAGVQTSATFDRIGEMLIENWGFPDDIE